MNSALVTDIETVPLAASMLSPYPKDDRKPPANYAKPEAINGWHDRDEADWRKGLSKACALDPKRGRILCIGTSEGMHYATTEAEERQTLLDFWAATVMHDGKVVTWNGRGFDLRFILIRSLVQNVAPTLAPAIIRSWFKRYVYDYHMDCKMALTDWSTNYVTGEGLDEWSTALGLPGKTDGITGADVYPMYLAGKHQEIADYCMADVAATREIYNRIAPYFLDRA